MKKLLSVKYSPGAFNAAMLILRTGAGVLMLSHGYDKLIHFNEKHNQFMSFMGMSSTVSYTLVVFAEFFCSVLLIMGLFTRLATIPLIIAMSVALIKAHGGDFWGDGEHAALYLCTYLVLLFTGPGRISIDGMINK